MKEKPGVTMKKVPFGQVEGQMMLFEIIGVGDYFVPCHECGHDKALLSVDLSILFCSKCQATMGKSLEGKLKPAVIVGESSWSLT